MQGNYFYQPAYSSHYAQAYSQYYYPVNSPAPLNSQAHVWHRPGTHKCSYRGCSFAAGSQKVLEIHRMDRHLIYPPGWDKQKKAAGWDADPSLKGKPIPVIGTNLNLDKPEDLAVWLAERQKRWPTTFRVEEKKRKVGEAIARGQIPETLNFHKNKKPRTTQSDRIHHDSGRGRGLRRGNLHWKPQRAITRPTSRIANQHVPAHREFELLDTSTPLTVLSVETNDDDNVPEVISSKAPASQLSSARPSARPGHVTKAFREDHAGNTVNQLPPQPKTGAHNPFASRPSLLLNLLLPEIRVTISNLSQAIKFLVDNDFLEGVEPTPGAAASGLIQVISGR